MKGSSLSSLRFRFRPRAWTRGREREERIAGEVMVMGDVSGETVGIWEGIEGWVDDADADTDATGCACREEEATVADRVDRRVGDDVNGRGASGTA